MHVRKILITLNEEVIDITVYRNHGHIFHIILYL